MQQQTVFISYRRALSKHLARSIYMDLRSNGWDVFLDVNTIDSGDFDRIILNQIGARAHFILLISKGSLERCANVGDWVLREIEEAVRLNRNIVPIIEEEASFTQEIAYLPEKLRTIIGKKNALPLPHFFFLLLGLASVAGSHRASSVLISTNSDRVARFVHSLGSFE